MKNEITPEQALNNLYQAARQAPLNANDHDLVRVSVEILLNALKTKVEVDTTKEDNQNEK